MLLLVVECASRQVHSFPIVSPSLLSVGGTQYSFTPVKQLCTMGTVLFAHSCTNRPLIVNVRFRISRQGMVTLAFSADSLLTKGSRLVYI